MKYKVEGCVRQAAVNAVKQYSRYQMYSNQVYFTADNFPAHARWHLITIYNIAAWAIKKTCSHSNQTDPLNNKMDDI